MNNPKTFKTVVHLFEKVLYEMHIFLMEHGCLGGGVKVISGIGYTNQKNKFIMWTDFKTRQLKYMLTSDLLTTLQTTKLL